MTSGRRGILTASLLVFFLLRDFEKFSPVPYNDGVGVMTIGYGHQIRPGENLPVPMSREYAEKLLQEDVRKHQEIIYRHVKVPLTQSQHDALVSFAFNVGEKTFKESGLLKELNRGNYEEVPRRLAMYTKGDIDGDGDLDVLRGLERRRAAEVDLWHGRYEQGKRY